MKFILPESQPFKYAPNLKGIAIFYSIIGLNLVLILTKNRRSPDLVIAEASSHISNFAITSMIVALLAFIMSLQGAPFKFVIWLGIAAIVMNFVVEVLIPIMNTPDIIDAFYGTAGVLVTGAVMYIFFKVGIRT